MNLNERKQKLEKLKEEYKNGTRDRKAIELEARALKMAIKISERKNQQLL